MQNQYKIRGTSVTAPCEVRLTPAETRLVHSLEKHFQPENIFPDYYAFKVSAQTRRIDFSAFNVSSSWSEIDGSEYTQIDCVAVNRQGVFVFESKDLTGFIYGRGWQIYWTQVYEYGHEKAKIYNPVKQNATHVRAIADFIDKDIPIYSVCVFGAESTLKSVTELPDRCFACLQVNIHEFFDSLVCPKPLSVVTVAQISKAIARNRIPANFVTRKDHAEDISEHVEHRFGVQFKK